MVGAHSIVKRRVDSDKIISFTFQRNLEQKNFSERNIEGK